MLRGCGLTSIEATGSRSEFFNSLAGIWGPLRITEQVPKEDLSVFVQSVRQIKASGGALPGGHRGLNASAKARRNCRIPTVS